MNVEINLITNAITNAIQKYYPIDSMILQVISSIILKSLSFANEKIGKINANTRGGTAR